MSSRTSSNSSAELQLVPTPWLEQRTAFTTSFAEKLDNFLFRSWLVALCDTSISHDEDAVKAKTSLQCLLKMRKRYASYTKSANGNVVRTYKSAYTPRSVARFVSKYRRDRVLAPILMDAILRAVDRLQERYPLDWEEENEEIDPMDDEEYEDMCQVDIEDDEIGDDAGIVDLTL